MDGKIILGSAHTPELDQLRKKAILRRVRMRQDAIRRKDTTAVEECENAIKFLTAGLPAKTPLQLFLSGVKKILRSI